MLKKANRLKSPGAFKKALHSPKAAQSPYFSLYCLPYPKAGNLPFQPNRRSPRFGIIISKKVDKRANRRNRIKRRIREILRLDVIPMLLQSERDMAVGVILVRHGCLDATYQALRKALLVALNLPVPSLNEGTSQ